MLKVFGLGSLAIAVTAIGATLAACSSSGNSAAGQSCQATSDCKSGLVCIDDTCVTSGSGSSSSGGASSSGSGSGSSSGSGSGAVSSSSGSGSSSSSGGTTSSSGASGSSSSSGGSTVDAAAAAHLGSRGDACQATPDCGPGLECILLNTGVSGGVCDVSSYGLSAAATGKTCTGECNTATDCCELPVNVTIHGVAYHDCNDIQNQVIGSASCSGLTAGDTTDVGVGCFYYQTYCSCGSSTWACTNNQCVYNAACMSSGTSFDGCAPLTRTGRGLVQTCTNSTCSSAAATGCSTAADCSGKPYVPFSGTVASGALCRAPGATGTTDCTCQNSACYLMCSKDLDCADGYTCDTTSHLCKSSGTCATNAQCATAIGNVTAVCTAGVCSVPCSTDHDCSASGASGSVDFFNGTVCSNGTCQKLGCTSDTDCNTVNGSTEHVFCVTPAAPAAAAEVSAITN